MNATTPADEAVVLEVSEFYERLSTHIESEFGRRRMSWVRGEISKIYEKNHLYLDVVDASGDSDTQPAVLKVRCWQSVWAPLKRDLKERGIALEEGSVIRFCGYVGVYRPRGEIGFAVTTIDLEGLEGDLARQRAALIEQLGAEGVFDANKATSLLPVPLRLGLVSSPRTEGFNDFTGQLTGSGLSFAVSLVATTVQGDSAPSEIVKAIRSLSTSGVDAICIVRGGGSKGDLACFDDERVARAIAACPVPVLTGIGHTGDVSIADLAAYHVAITPTKLGEFLVTMVAEWRQRQVIAPAGALERATAAILEEADEYVRERRRTITFALRDRFATEQVQLDHRRSSVGRHARQVLDSEAAKLTSMRQLVVAYDPQRRLEQGWSISTNASGGVVKSVDDVASGDVVNVRVADGSIVTTVTETKEGHG